MPDLPETALARLRANANTIIGGAVNFLTLSTARRFPLPSSAQGFLDEARLQAAFRVFHALADLSTEERMFADSPPFLGADRPGPIPQVGGAVLVELPPMWARDP